MLFQVKLWNTINEPRNIVLGYGYTDGGVVMAPMVRQSGIADYLAAHTLLRAHAKAYRLYDKEFRPTYGGKLCTMYIEIVVILCKKLFVY